MATTHQYDTLKKFTDYLDSNNKQIPFKIMGKKRVKGPYYTISMLKEVYNNIPDPDSQIPFRTIKAPFGDILERGCRLATGNSTYSSSVIPNQITNNNILQGDIIELDLSNGGNAFPKHKLSMVISHSCSIDNSSNLNVIPVYTESELTQDAIEILRGKAPKDHAAVMQNWFANESVNFLGLPAEHIPVSNESGDRMLACLHLSVLLNKVNVPDAPCLRLTYRALAYVQLRIGLLYLRDVQDSDDTREY